MEWYHIPGKAKYLSLSILIIQKGSTGMLNYKGAVIHDLLSLINACGRNYTKKNCFIQANGLVKDLPTTLLISTEHDSPCSALVFMSSGNQGSDV